MNPRTASLAWRALGLVAFTLAGLGGCHQVGSPPPPEGNASFRFLEPPAPPPSSGKGTIEVMPNGPVYLPARPKLPLAIPVYPPVALRARGFGTTVSVHVVVDATGRVTEVRPSLFGFTMPSPFAREFFAAVEYAVSQWKFQPAELRFPERVALEGKEGFRNLVRSERVETEFDVAFLFTSTGAVVMPR